MSGNADRHPKLGENVYISRTSPLVHAEIVDDVLMYETRNTIYKCPLKYIDLKHPYQNVEKKYMEELAMSAESDDCLMNIIGSVARILLNREDTPFMKHLKELAEIGQKELLEMREKEEKRLMSIVEKWGDSIYIEVSCIECGNLLAYHMGDSLGVVYPRVHIGMFQDSVLYTKARAVDFRYFPNGESMESYSWSDNIKYVYLKNIKNYEIYFNNERIGVNETKCFTIDGHSQGLVSPDCVTGKSPKLLP